MAELTMSNSLKKSLAKEQQEKKKQEAEQKKQRESKDRAEIVVPVSGGKDSQACLKLAIQEVGADKVLGLFCDTQFEHPLTYEHVDRIKELYRIRIEVRTGGSVPEKVRKYKRFPGEGASRHCTDELKMRVSRDFYKELASKQGGFEVWYGMRTGESVFRRTRYAGKGSEELYAPHELFPRKYPKSLAEKFNVWFKVPVLGWTSEEVLEFIAGEENPLYGMGFGRVGCFPCLASGDQHKKRAFEFDEFGRKQREIVRFLEKDIGRSVWIAEKYSDDSGEVGSEDKGIGSGCMICQM